MLFSAMTLADPPEIPKPDFSCLSQEQEQKIAICFAENKICHDSLADAVSPPAYEEDWTVFIGVLVLGALGGMALEYNWRH